MMRKRKIMTGKGAVMMIAMIILAVSTYISHSRKGGAEYGRK